MKALTTLPPSASASAGFQINEIKASAGLGGHGEISKDKWCQY